MRSRDTQKNYNFCGCSIDEQRSEGNYRKEREYYRIEKSEVPKKVIEFFTSFTITKRNDAVIINETRNTIKQAGITLISLIITVIIMLILAGIAISLFTGENGILLKARFAAEKWENAIGDEANDIKDYDYSVDTIEDIKQIEVDLEFTYTPNKWTNGNVAVGIINSLENEGYKAEYSLNQGATWNTYLNAIEMSQNNSIVLARLVKSGAISNVSTGNVNNIDKVAPISFSASGGSITDSSFKISASTVDGAATATSGQSGIKEYKYYIKKSTDQNYTSEIVDSGTTSKTYANLTQSTTYNVYVEAYDNAGNKTTTAVVDVTTANEPRVKEYTNSLIINRGNSYQLTNATAQQISTGVIKYIIQPGGEVVLITYNSGSNNNITQREAFVCDVLSYNGNYIEGADTQLDCVFANYQASGADSSYFERALNQKLKMGLNDIDITQWGNGPAADPGWWTNTDVYATTTLKIKNNTAEQQTIIVGTMYCAAVIDMTGTCVSADTNYISSNNNSSSVANFRSNSPILAWDEEKAEFVQTEVFFVERTYVNTPNAMRLKFNNGKILELVAPHFLFDYTQNKHIVLWWENVYNLLNHEFAYVDTTENNKITTTKLIDVESFEYKGYGYEVIPKEGYVTFPNGFASGALSLVLGPYEHSKEELLVWDKRSVEISKNTIIPEECKDYVEKRYGKELANWFKTELPVNALDYAVYSGKANEYILQCLEGYARGKVELY